MALTVLLALSAAFNGAADAASSTCTPFGHGGGEGDSPSCDVQLMAPSLLQRRSSVQRIGGPLALEQGDLCAPFQWWPAVDNNVLCGSCRALVETWPFHHRCDKYCESFGHVCVAAAEEVSDDCEVKYTHHCDEPFHGTSDMLCTCLLPKPLQEQQKSIACDHFDQWPDVDGGVTCGSCQALISSASYGNRCDRYCESFGHICVAAAEELAESCAVQSEHRCDETIQGTSDILCTCSWPTNETHAPSASSTTPKIQEPVGPDVEVKEETLTCDPFVQWPSIDSGVVCGDCTALVLAAPYGGRCDKFCESFGHICVGAAEEDEDTCTALYTAPCDVEIAQTSDVLCTCHLPTEDSTPSATIFPGGGAAATTTTAEATTVTLVTTVGPVEPTTLECCAPYLGWPSVDNHVTCGASCTALVETAPYGGRCDRYCESFGHVCVAAAEEEEEDCTVKYMGDCDREIQFTTDMLCTCQLPVSAETCPDSATLLTPAPRSTEPSMGIEVKGRQLLAHGKPLHLKGVAWNPVNKGKHHSNGVDFRGNVERDATIMVEAGINAVRTYVPITDWDVLDTLWSHGIWVINSVFNYGRTPASSVKHKVDAVKDHPAILMWTIGNEWNYNGLYVGMGFWDSVAKLEEVAGVIKQADTMHPIACIYGELGGLRDAASRLTNVDIWGINVYRGNGFGNLFNDFKGLTSKPMFLGEYGADAWNALINREDLKSQADATRELTEEIVRQSSVTGGPCIGGFAFELADEWWKDGDGRPDRHDIGGFAPGGGPHPDNSFNEEWWGLVDIDRQPRPALFALRDVGLPA